MNRGWVPTRKEVKYPSVPESKEVEITAVVRKTEPRPTFVGKKSGDPNLYLYR